VTFDLGVHGHAPVMSTLRRVWADGSGPRTLLFSGPDGVGRRPVARWFAALVNCEHGAPAERPCGTCRSCAAMAAGVHPDLREVAPATTTRTGRSKRRVEITIDQLVEREQGDPEPLTPWLRSRPRHRVRVGVIDHADAMNQSAANAFLKMLEEPPAWAAIVLIAPGPDAVLPTVASRSTVIRFGAVAPEVLSTLVGDDALRGHPAFRTGQAGALLRARLAPESTAAARDAARAYLDALEGDLLDSLEGAEELAKALAAAADAGADPDPLGWLREPLRKHPPTVYAAALEQIESCEDALAAYAQPALACSVLTLRLRALLSSAPG